MSESLRRKSSSRQLLQNLISVTAQRSQEDAEEVERERRRRSRETPRGEQSPASCLESPASWSQSPASCLESPASWSQSPASWPQSPASCPESPASCPESRASCPESPQRNELAHNTPPDEELKPRCCLVLEEDEGFSDWSHRLENRSEREVQPDCRAGRQRPSTQRRKPRPEEEKRQEGEEEEEEEEAGRSRRSQEASARPPEKVSVDRKEVKMSYSSTVFLSHDARPQHAVGQPDRTSYLVAGTMSGRACRVDGEVQQEEVQQKLQQKLQQELQQQEVQQQEVQEMQAARQKESRETRRSSRDEDDDEEGELSFTEEEKEYLHLRREEKHREEEEEEEEEHRMPDKSLTDSSSRTSEEGNRRDGGEEPLNYGPMSPTFKKLLIQFYPEEVNSRVSADAKCSIIERTESLRKSSGNVKKTLPPVAVSKIDRKLELYAHALELSTQEGRSGTQALADLTSPTEPVSSKKSLFEAGEAWSQSAGPGTPSKDADALKVGVANLINQWVKGSEDGSRCSSPSRPAESSSGKRYKFVVTGHGKYEKVSEDFDCREEAHCSSAGQFYEDL